MGKYAAGVHHLHMLHANLGKDAHGLRARDIDRKDKQNFDAALNIIGAAPHLQKIPDALGTKYFIDVMQCIVDSYLKRSLEPLEQVEKNWYALFFLRYWCSWISVHPSYSLQKNFVTSNAFKCVELNAHALIIALMVVRDNFEGKCCFLPWLLGLSLVSRLFRQ